MKYLKRFTLSLEIYFGVVLIIVSCASLLEYFSTSSPYLHPDYFLYFILFIAGAFAVPFGGVVSILFPFAPLVIGLPLVFLLATLLDSVKILDPKKVHIFFVLFFVTFLIIVMGIGIQVSKSRKKIIINNQTYIFDYRLKNNLNENSKIIFDINNLNNKD